MKSHEILTVISFAHFISADLLLYVNASDWLMSWDFHKKSKQKVSIYMRRDSQKGGHSD